MPLEESLHGCLLPSSGLAAFQRSQTDAFVLQNLWPWSLKFLPDSCPQDKNLLRRMQCEQISDRNCGEKND